MLKATDPLQVAKYVQLLYSYLCEENIFKRLDKLENSFDQEVYEKIDTAITKAMLCAEQKCYRPRKYPLPEPLYHILLQLIILD